MKNKLFTICTTQSAVNTTAYKVTAKTEDDAKQKLEKYIYDGIKNKSIKLSYEPEMEWGEEQIID